MFRGTRNEWHEYLRRSGGQTEEFGQKLTRALQNGEITLPQLQQQPANYGGGVNQCPNSDLSYSKDAATVPGTLPATAGDGNHEAYRFFRQVKGANVGVAAADALKATAHSLFAANESATPAIPRWNRVGGWIEIGAAGATQYDIAIRLLQNVVQPGAPWFVRFRCAALDPAVLPAGVQAFAGLWVKTGAGEGWAAGSAFNLSHGIEGIPGSQSIDYRVLAKTDSGVSILSNVLNVPNAPSALSVSNYVKLFYNAGPGFIVFEIYKKVGASYYHVYTVRNSSDLQYNDTGVVGVGPVQGWPSVTQNAPLAYAETKNLLVAAYGATWSPNDLTVNVPAAYDFSQTQAEGQFLRIGLTAPTGVDRHVGIDRIWFGATFNEWGPDVIRLADGTYPVPTIAPTSGNQGGGSGVYTPPSGGSGGRTCVLADTPVLTVERGRHVFRQFRSVRVGAQVKGDERAPYLVVGKKVGSVSEYYEIRTANGVCLRCTVDHPLIGADWEPIQARHAAPGARLRAWAGGRKTTTRVVSQKLVPVPAEVGTFTLRHSGGLRRDGEGLYLAGRSKGMDRALFCHNVKPVGAEFS